MYIHTRRQLSQDESVPTLPPSGPAGAFVYDDGGASIAPSVRCIASVSIEGRVVSGRRRRVARSICAERPSRPGFAVASTWVIVRGPFAVFVLCGRLDSGSSC